MYAYGEVGMVYAALIFRSSMIAFKYATYSPTYLEHLKKEMIRLGELKRKMYIEHWFTQHNSIIYEEIYTVLRKNDVDEGILYIRFFKPPTK